MDIGKHRTPNIPDRRNDNIVVVHAGAKAPCHVEHGVVEHSLSHHHGFSHRQKTRLPRWVNRWCKQPKEQRITGYDPESMRSPN